MQFTSSEEYLDIKRFERGPSMCYSLFFSISEALEKQTGNKYLAKSLLPKIYELNKEEMTFYCRGANIYCQLNHPSILKYVGYSPIYFDDDPSPVIITEYAENRTLFNLLSSLRENEPNSNWNDTKKLINIYGIASAMSYLHSHDIIHRDLKPEHIFLDSNLYPKLSSFLLSTKLTDAFLKSDIISGTPAYLSPEVFSEGKYSKASDVYSFSLVVFELMTSELPFDTFSDKFSFIEELMSKKIRPKINDSVPSCYRNLIEKCWSEKVEERPTFDEIIETLEKDPNFITETVDKSEYLNYINFIKMSKTTFDSTKKIEQLDDILHNIIQFYRSDNQFLKSDSQYVTLTNVNSLKLTPCDLKNYEKHEKIGEGRFGKVYKIVDKRSNEIFAVKVSLHESNEFTEDIIKKINDEASCCSLFDFPSVIKFFGFSHNNFSNKPKPTYIIEYSQNGSLHQLLNLLRKGEKVAEWNDTKRLINIFGIAAGMSYLYNDFGLIHFDLKPDNILLDEHLYPKITDFTLARYSNQLFDTDFEFNGTLEYVGPEVFISEEIDNHFDDDLANQAEIINEITKNHRRPLFKKEIPACYKDLIEKCWTENPMERPNFTEIVDILSNDPNFITEKVDKEEFLNYVKIIETAQHKATYNYQTNRPEFIVHKDILSFPKVNIYSNRIKETKKITINIAPIDLSQFEILKKVGEGNYGAVYKIIKKDKKEEVFAAKISLITIDECKEQQLISLEREVNIIRQLDHPSIMQFIGFNLYNFDYKQKPTIITEFLSKGSLEEIINLERNNIGNPDWNDTMKLINIFGIASGMSYLHSHNFIHRDLKPANILLDELLHPKISDFGLSKRLSNDDSKSGFKGTYAYSAPETFHEDYSKACDVYSFALIVYEIITCDVIFPRFNQFALMKQVMDGYRPPFNFQIPDCYRKLIEECWQDDPSKRPTFDDIVFMLKNNPDFITENVDEEEFLDYVDLIDEPANSLESKEQNKSLPHEKRDLKGKPENGRQNKSDQLNKIREEEPKDSVLFEKIEEETEKIDEES